MKDFLEKYNRPGPRYTSYPPATAFDESFTFRDYEEAVEESNLHFPQNISLYIHIPFCPQHCYYCGCNTCIGANAKSINRYLDCLKQEIVNVSKLLSPKRQVTQIHWGGGTPNAIAMSSIQEIMALLRDKFCIAEKCEIAIECAPAYLGESQVKALAEAGFNRISLGIQDFHDDVLNAVNRKPSRLPLDELVQLIRDKGFESINFDLIYGLPLQTVASFKENIAKAIVLRPDRLATFSYAHVPWAMPHQQELEKFTLPTAQEKMQMLLTALNDLSEAGYCSIGMDHYALPGDPLAIAQKEYRLHRNFQGYCTADSTGQVYAFGASAISQMYQAYSQNFRDVEHYCDSIEGSGFATFRGYTLNQNEIVCRRVINEIMCNGLADFQQIAEEFDSIPDEILDICGFKQEKIEEFTEDELLDFSGYILRVTPRGMLVVRNIAMAFDPELKIGKNQFSKTV